MLEIDISDATTPRDRAISKEEEAILWRSLSELPATYREPLVLFYRQQQSVAEVAGALELSEDTVKQRLSRGRAMLAEQVTAFIEGALRQTTPGKVFTLTVLAALPVLTTSAKAALVGATAAKGSATAKAAAGVGLLNAILGPLLGLFGSWIGYRMSLDSAKSEREREFVKMFYRRVLVLVAVFTVLLTSLILWGAKSARAHPNLFAGAIVSVIVGYVAVLLGMIVWSRRKFREFWAEQAKIDGDVRVPVREYRSKITLLGLPLVHIRLNERFGKEGPVKAWIAAGDRAYGLLLAFGGVAVAPISCGGLAIGLLPWGGCAFGLFAVGGLAIGGWAFGGLAVGWLAFGGCAMGWHAAMGGLAVARDFALGGFAQAAQANNRIAAQFIKTNWFFQNMQIVARHLGWLNLLWIVPLILWWRALAHRTKRNN